LAVIFEFNRIYSHVAPTTPFKNIFGGISLVLSLVGCVGEFEGDMEVMEQLQTTLGIIAKVGRTYPYQACSALQRKVPKYEAITVLRSQLELQVRVCLAQKVI
jgi:hypothetical protein